MFSLVDMVLVLVLLVIQLGIFREYFSFFYGRNFFGVFFFYYFGGYLRLEIGFRRRYICFNIFKEREGERTEG